MDIQRDIKSKVKRKFDPPMDVLLDPSLLVASRSLEGLDDSPVFASQTQATLGRTPTESRLGELYVPETYADVVSSNTSSADVQSEVWDFFRGKASASHTDSVSEAINENNIKEYSVDAFREPESENADFVGETHHDRIQEILIEEFAFLQSGGLILSSKPTSIEVFRDSGVPTIDIGNGSLEASNRETLSGIGYQNPVKGCTFGVTIDDSTADKLTGAVLARQTNFLIYHIGE